MRWFLACSSNKSRRRHRYKQTAETPRSMGRLGASACTIRSQHAQTSFGRTCRISLNRAGTYSRISETSSPRCFNSPPQSWHAICFGEYFPVSRCKCPGRGRRVGFVAFTSGTAGVCDGASCFACVASGSLGDQQLQVFDFVVARRQLLSLLKSCSCGIMKSAAPRHPRLRSDHNAHRGLLARQVLQRDGWRC
jgi:hypothetical protein